MTLEDGLKSLAIEEGCIRAGIARRETFSEAPPSADVRYLKPWANAVVSFAVSTGTDRTEDYLGKVAHRLNVEYPGASSPLFFEMKAALIGM